jgi:hypothetical protein
MVGSPFVLSTTLAVDLLANQEDSVRLRRHQFCPIHRSLYCCGRGEIPKERRQRQLGVRRIDDPQHPRGYRELRSNGEMRKLVDRKIVAQNGICGICKEKFTNYSDVVPDHIMCFKAYLCRAESIMLPLQRTATGLFCDNVHPHSFRGLKHKFAMSTAWWKAPSHEERRLFGYSRRRRVLRMPAAGIQVRIDRNIKVI